MLRFEQRFLEAMRRRLRLLPPTKEYEKMMPAELQEDAAEYARRARRCAAVAVPLLNVEGEAAMLFTVRSKRVNTHAGHVSFPGGHVDAGETIHAAAIRELEEETAVRDMQVLGEWHRVRAITGTMVTPVIGFVPHEFSRIDIGSMVQHARSSPEVDSCFSVTLRELTSPGIREMNHVRGRWVMPRFNVMPQPIWGLTAFILDGVLRDAFNWDASTSNELVLSNKEDQEACAD
eukprot:6183221-Pleurochrysis_carterae.AAC.3